MATKPTAANILASLGVKGTISGIPTGGVPSDYVGFLPMLDKDGKLSADFIPSSVVEKVVRPIRNVAVVDLGTSVAAEDRSGSIVAPYKTIHEAAAKVGFDASGRCAIILMPGKYTGNDNSYAEFSNAPDNAADIAIIGIGECELGATTFNVSGVSGCRVFLQNISTDSSVKVFNAAFVTCIRTYIGGQLQVGSCPLRLSSDSRVASTDAQDIRYLSEASRIGNGSSVPGATVKDALERLGARKIRLVNIVLDSSGLGYDSSSYVDIDDGSASMPIFDLSEHDRILLEGIRRIVKLNETIVAKSVTSETVKAKDIEAESLNMDSLVISGCRISVDPYGYLVVIDTAGESSGGDSSSHDEDSSDSSGSS